MSKHTPGPWKITSLARNGVINHRVHFPGTAEFTGTCVATVEPEDDNGAAARVADANAKLIAAAPDLLEALQTLLAQYRKGRTSNDLFIAHSEAALAKAGY